jgi:N-acetylglucosaminyldiphosphoundecaprenol N-acetyl-beta-D-mannosaminyltransferase
MYANRRRVPVIGVQVDLLNWDDAIEQIAAWGREHASRYVCFSNVHSAVTAAFDGRFHRVVAESDMCTSDGAPVTWMLRQLGAPNQRRLNGPDLMWRYFAAQAPHGGKVYFYGSTPETLALLRARVEAEFPGLQVVGTYSPPFRALSADEDDEDAARINASGAHVVFVGLGCPKQEMWMARQRGRINAVMMGVGAAFDYHAGVQPRAPEWLQHHGLEWAHRLLHDPRRLWRRYLFTNVPFLFMGGAQWLSSRITGARPAAMPPVAPATQDDEAISPVQRPWSAERSGSAARAE